MVNAKFIAEFFRKRLGSVGIFSLILAAFEKILDQEFVCPCDRTYNIVVCVLYGAVPSICCFVFTFCFMDGYSEMEDERMRDLHTCDKLLYSILTTIIWLFLFFVDGRYLACAVSVWGGVYAKNETLGIVKWCKPTGNETVVFTSQQDTLKWISRSQILGFIIMVLIPILLLVLHCKQRRVTQRNISKMETLECSKMRLHGRLAERKFSFEVEETTCL
ncbi:uncharacterized protein LOC124379206 [Silurus meridionalis]|uniref:Uncharacterized protein n=1 Tax=Silurus meridionalis TaxID=175797 RepID=A0A8T0ACP6_SILME|nr:uncharacterized protein LOC124379206 [Silurus meridionalis]KAF7689031.1 hypothetical protein HF521_013838 [Silurus meridionalis]